MKINEQQYIEQDIFNEKKITETIESYKKNGNKDFSYFNDQYLYRVKKDNKNQEIIKIKLYKLLQSSEEGAFGSFRLMQLIGYAKYNTKNCTITYSEESKKNKTQLGVKISKSKNINDKAFLENEVLVSQVLLKNNFNVAKTKGFCHESEKNGANGAIFQKVGDMTLENYAKIPKDKRNPKVDQKIMKNLINEVNKMHKEGIAHRDIKPENIMVYSKAVKSKNDEDETLIPEGTIKIIDNAFVTNKDTSKMLCGTICYMPPKYYNKGKDKDTTLDDHKGYDCSAVLSSILMLYGIDILYNINYKIDRDTRRCFVIKNNNFKNRLEIDLNEDFKMGKHPNSTDNELKLAFAIIDLEQEERIKLLQYLKDYKGHGLPEPKQILEEIERIKNPQLKQKNDLFVIEEEENNTMQEVIKESTAKERKRSSNTESNCLWDAICAFFNCIFCCSCSSYKGKEEERQNERKLSQSITKHYQASKF